MSRTISFFTFCLEKSTICWCIVHTYTVPKCEISFIVLLSTGDSDRPLCYTSSPLLKSGTEHRCSSQGNIYHGSATWEDISKIARGAWTFWVQWRNQTFKTCKLTLPRCICKVPDPICLWVQVLSCSLHFTHTFLTTIRFCHSPSSLPILIASHLCIYFATK